MEITKKGSVYTIIEEKGKFFVVKNLGIYDDRDTASKEMIKMTLGMKTEDEATKELHKKLYGK